ncbi:MAG: response regulator [Candidatus Omnitrophica bacterium]|nr:response regulator [Candidatus Omnitrophota bacterium]MCB9747551.1 response regulator [Candidatus Omnitrophota bacterium]
MSNPLKVLVVDDKRIIGDFFEFVLGYKGHEIEVVQDPMKALETARKQEFDIAFVDIVMPEKDGVELLEEFRRVVPKLPVVMISGYSVDEKRKRAKDLGALCLKKPFEFEDIQRVIKDLLGREI